MQLVAQAFRQAQSKACGYHKSTLNAFLYKVMIAAEK
jgi:hypothetical protein